jgi:hypothetical protein
MRLPAHIEPPKDARFEHLAEMELRAGAVGIRQLETRRRDHRHVRRHPEGAQPLAVAAGNSELCFARERRVVDQSDPAADPRVQARTRQRTRACREGGAQVQAACTARRQRGKVHFDARRGLVDDIERRVRCPLLHVVVWR